jgi:hypothetical protein
MTIVDLISDIPATPSPLDGPNHSSGGPRSRDVTREFQEPTA